jgi:single-strand DNA-binding protein
MSTRFFGEGNLGADAEYKEFSQDNSAPVRLLRMTVYFDNPVPKSDGFEDKGGFWAPVELWHADAERWCHLFRTGMRVLVDGKMVRDDWRDEDDNARVTFKVRAKRIGILPFRIADISIIPREPSGS